MPVAPNLYIVRPRDTLRKIAWLYTGSPDKWSQIVAANPHLPKRWIVGPSGRALTFGDLRIGQTIFLPIGWSRKPRFWLPAPVLPRWGAGTVGQELGPGGKCDPGSPITNVKPYVYNVGGDELPYQVAQKFGAGSKWQELRRANYDDPDGFIYYTPANPDGTPAGTICTWAVWSGKKLKIPASWPDPPKGSALWNQIEVAGQPGTTTPGTTTPGTPGTGIEPVGYTEGEDKTSKMPYLWALLGVAVGVTGIVVVARATRKKTPERREQLARLERSRIQPQALPPGP